MKLKTFLRYSGKQDILKKNMKNYIEPYVKENNLLQLSLFYFADKRPKKTVTEWEDSAGNNTLTCICDYGVPGSFDQDVYTACMRIWVKQGMPVDGIKLNYSDIARELHLYPPKDWVKRIKQSLQKLAFARYEFTQCFIQADKDGNKRIDAYFSLFDSASLFTHEKGKSKRNSESKLIFPDEIKKNLESKYYQLLDMVWYRALPEGLPRRLFEYLAKKHYQNVNGAFIISEGAMCRWLPIFDKHSTKRRKRLEEIAQPLIEKGFLKDYRFDKIKAQCIYTYSNSIMAKPPEQFQKDDSLKKVLVSQPDKIVEEPIQEKILSEGQIIEQQIGEENFTQEQANEEQIISLQTSKETPQEIIQPQATTQPSLENQKDQEIFCDAIKWIASIQYFNEKRRDEIARLPFHQVAKVYPGIKKQYEHMKSAGSAPKPGWVYQAFMELWQFPDHPTKEQLKAEKDTQREKEDQERLAKQIEEREKYEERKKELERIEKEFLQLIEKEEAEIAKIAARAWQEAETSVKPDAMRREFQVKLAFMKLVAKHLGTNTEQIGVAVLGNLATKLEKYKCA